MDKTPAPLFLGQVMPPCCVFKAAATKHSYTTQEQLEALIARPTNKTLQLHRGEVQRQALQAGQGRNLSVVRRRRGSGDLQERKQPHVPTATNISLYVCKIVNYITFHLIICFNSDMISTYIDTLWNHIEIRDVRFCFFLMFSVLAIKHWIFVML